MAEAQNYLPQPRLIELSKNYMPHKKAELGRAIEQVALNVECGEEKTGDLAGIKVYKFRLTNQRCLLAYRILNRHGVKLLAFGHRENFYRDLKRGVLQVK